MTYADVLTLSGKRLLRQIVHRISPGTNPEQGSRRQEKRVEDIAANLDVGVYVLDQDGRLVFMNHSAARILGWQRTELLGKKAHDIVHCRRPDKTVLTGEDCPVRKAIREGKTYRARHDIYLCKNGGMVPVSFVSAPLIDEGAFRGSVTVFHDISEHLRREDEREFLVLELLGALAKEKPFSGDVAERPFTGKYTPPDRAAAAHSRTHCHTRRTA